MTKDNKIVIANSIRTIGDTNKKKHFNECNKMAFHYLTTHDKPSMNIIILLGLGQKEYTQSRKMQLNNSNRMIDRFKIDVRLKDCLT